jgi:hypothetical protein
MTEILIVASEKDPADLTFSAGDIIEIVEETNADWWKGRFNGRDGLFPSNYVEKITTAASPSLSKPSFPLVSAGPVSEKQPLTGSARFIPPPPPQGHSSYPTSSNDPHGQQPAVVVEPEKKSKFGKIGKTAGTAAVGGLGFGAGECSSVSLK